MDTENTWAAAGGIEKQGPLPENYLYISHLDKSDCNISNFSLISDTPHYQILPCYPEAISDNMSSNFNSTNALGRSAPVQTYSNSGPRTVQISLKLHRDIMWDLNYGVSNADEQMQIGEDYVDSLCRAIQSIALPKYNLTNKLIEPPLVAVRLANEVFIKGVVNGNVGITYGLPIIESGPNKVGKYAVLNLSFSVSEVDPYDATTVYKNGTFRGVVNTMRKGMGLE